MAKSFFLRFSYGGRVPSGVGFVMTLIVVSSLLAAFTSRHSLPLMMLMPLIPDQVWAGQAWRLVTWALLEMSPWSLLFRVLVLYWFAGDLERTWGRSSFLRVYIGLTLFAAVGTCLLALVDAAIGPQLYFGTWALDAAIIVAWGLTFPDRILRMYFVIAIPGRLYAWGTLAITFASAVYYGWEYNLPIVLAELGMLAWLFRGKLQRRWLEAKRARLRRQQQKDRETRAAKGPGLALVDDDNDDDLEPLSAEDEAKLKDEMGGKPPPASKPRLVN